MVWHTIHIFRLYVLVIFTHYYKHSFYAFEVSTKNGNFYTRCECLGSFMGAPNTSH